MSKQRAVLPPNFPLSRRRFLQKGLAAGALAAGIPVQGLASGGRIGPAEGKGTTSTGTEDIRGSQSTVLETEVGRVEKLRMGERAFLDGEEVLGYVPEEFLGRRYILAPRSGLRARCTSAGYVYAVAAAESEQAAKLQEMGFKALDFPNFEIFQGGRGEHRGYVPETCPLYWTHACG